MSEDERFDADSLMTEPDATGRFGEFGGRFIPETLIPACQELEAGFRDAWSDPGFRTELDTILRDYAGRPSMLTECFRLSDELGVAGVAQARRPQPHRLAQDQQRARPGAARQADGQDPPRRRDRRRPARRRDRDRGGADGPRVQGVHGRRRRRPPGPQRVPHAAARLGGRSRAQRIAHAQGRRQRGLARLGGDRRRHALLPRFGDGAAPVSVDGAPVPPRDRRRSPRAVPRDDRGRPRRRRRLRRRRIERDRHLLRFRRHCRLAWSASSPPAAPPSDTVCPVSCTACAAF